MKILVPDYLLNAVLRHYEVLAQAYIGNDIKACNAQRVAVKEINKVRTIISKQKHG